MIHFNNQNTFKEIHYNSHDIKYMYGGCSGDLVWGKQTPGSKLRYTTTSGDTYTIPCDLTGVITSVEIVESMDSHGIPLDPYYNYALSDLVVGDCVNRIDDNAFNQMYTVSSITIPNSVITIGHDVFKETAISSITIPDSVTSIGAYAFTTCTRLTSVSIPDSTTSIGNYCFYNCSGLTSVEIGSGITSIGDMAFWGCSSLTAITFNATTPPTIGIGILGNETTYPIYVPCESVNAYKTAWSTYASRIQCIEPTPSYKWLATYDGGSTSSAECDSTSAISQNEISLTDLVDVQIGDCVTSIESMTFRYCRSLTSVTISNNITSIGGSAFKECTNLTSCTIGTGVTSIESMAFSGCRSLTSVTVNATTPPSLGSNAFNGSTCPIYVPSESVETYKAAAGWSTYASRIQAIPNS